MTTLILETEPLLTLLGYQARGFLVQSVGLPVDVTTNE
jgi:hypothetical protein